MNDILTIKNISGGYRKEEVIKGLSLNIKAGDFLGIIGPNGSGKSTLLKLMTRVLAPYSGDIEFSGVNIKNINLKKFCRKTAFVPQDTATDFSFSVLEIVLMGRIPHLGRLQTETKKDFNIAGDALSMTDSLLLKEKLIDELSAGERQRIFIARALAQEPELLLLDEPTAHLDIGHQIQILDLLRKLNRENGLTIVIVLHDLNLASQYCNRIVLLNQGQIFIEGSPGEVLTYQNIEAVYNTIVVVLKNPSSAKPYVVLVSREQEKERKGGELNSGT